MNSKKEARYKRAVERNIFTLKTYIRNNMEHRVKNSWEWKGILGIRENDSQFDKEIMDIMIDINEKRQTDLRRR